MIDVKQTVAILLEKAAKASDSADALRFSQAACNVANTKHALAEFQAPKD